MKVGIGCWLLVSGLTAALLAQPQAGGLKRTAEGYVHEPSKSMLVPPRDWRPEPAEPQQTGATSSLHLRHQGAAAEALVAWSPLNVKLDDAVAAEVALLAGIFGADKVGKPEQVTAGDRAGYRFTLDDGPSRNGKEAGVVYVFEAGPDEKTRWKVKVRGVFPKMGQVEAARAVENLVKGFRWE